jgi:hypothetical protein
MGATPNPIAIDIYPIPPHAHAVATPKCLPPVVIRAQIMLEWDPDATCHRRN